jgi:rhamnogalacturonyl hydrolase YesR
MRPTVKTTPFLVCGGLVGFAAGLALATPAGAAPQDSPAGILGAMQSAADWQLAHPSAHAPTDWTQGAGDAGMMALAGISGDPKYREAMRSACEASGWRTGPRLYDADDHCIGQTYAELYLLYRDGSMIAPLREKFDAILASPPPEQSLEMAGRENRARENWAWCDALFMGPPAWVRLYAATGDRRYLDFAVRNWWRTTDYLYDRDEHLFFRDSSYFQRREANGKKIFWSRGNGWVIAGLVRLLQFLPANHPDRPRFERLFREMAGKILACQQADGLWRSSLLDPDSYPLRETSGSGFHTYALAWGVNQGLLDRAVFKPAVDRAWSGLVGCLDGQGRLSQVQPIGADPKRFAGDSTEVYGVGAFLLAGSEVYRMSVLEAARPLAVKVANPSGFRRECETVELDSSALPAGHREVSRAAVMDGVSSRILDSQAYSPEPGRAPEKLIFQADLGPGEERTFYVMDAAALAATPRPLVKTFARQVPERFNDIAWESDRIAHRTYQLVLIQGEGTVTSGIDVWCKRTRNLVVDRFYANRDYHNDHGEGLDDYHVARSRGCGGLGIWDGERLHVSLNFHGARVITTGPVRSEFELTYDAWDAGGRRVSETKRISIDAGSNMSRAESVFASDNPSPLQVGVGIALRPDGGALREEKGAGWMSYWQPADRDRGSIGCAVVFPAGGIREFTAESATLPRLTPAQLSTPDGEGLQPVANLLAIVTAEPGRPLVYWLGAGWSRSGDFPDGAAWEAYVSRFRERLHAPVRVTWSAD